MNGGESEVIYALLLGFSAMLACLLWFRLQAFLSLTLAAGIVGLLTPNTVVERFLTRQQAWSQVQVNLSTDRLVGIPPGHTPAPGTRMQIVRLDPRRIVGWGEVEVISSSGGFATAKPLGETSLKEVVLGLDLVLPVDALPLIARLRNRTITERMAQAFGASFAEWGMVIAIACLLARFLEESGSAEKIARCILGSKMTGGAWTLMFLGFLMAIPLGYVPTMIAISAVARAMWSRTESWFLKYLLFLHVGAWAAPPLAFPFANLPPNTSHVAFLVGGLIIGLFGAIVGGVMINFLNRGEYLPHREKPEVVGDLKDNHLIHESRLPPLIVSLAPLFVPALLVCSGRVLTGKIFGGDLPAVWSYVLATLGSPPVALILGVLMAMGITPCFRNITWRKTTEKVHLALQNAGPLILGAVAAGAFGRIVQQTDIGAGTFQFSKTGLDWGVSCNFAFAAALELITSAGVNTIEATRGWAAASEQIPAVLLALAAFYGTKFAFWFNDPEFWVASQTSAMSETQGLKFLSICTAVVALALFLGSLACAIGYSSM